MSRYILTGNVANPFTDVAGLPLSEWLTLFYNCHHLQIIPTFGAPILAFHQWQFPNGMPLNEQSNLLIETFALIKSEAERHLNQKMSQKHG